MAEQPERLPLTNRQKDLVRVLACVMWTDGHASPAERKMVEQVIASLDPSDEERAEMLRWVHEDVSTLADVDIERLSEKEKQVLFRDAVLLALADDVVLPSERSMLDRLATGLGLPSEVVRKICDEAREDAAISLPSAALAGPGSTQPISPTVPPPAAPQTE